MLTIEVGRKKEIVVGVVGDDEQGSCDKLSSESAISESYLCPMKLEHSLTSKELNTTMS